MGSRFVLYIGYHNQIPNSIDLFIREEAFSNNEMNHATEPVSLFLAERENLAWVTGRENFLRERYTGA